MKNKRSTAFYLFLLSACCAAQSEETFITDGVRYSIIDEARQEVAISDVTEALEEMKAAQSTVLTLPEHVNFNGMEYSVTGLCNRVFYNADAVEEVALPEGLRWIEGMCFTGCPDLKTISAGQMLEYI